MTKFTLFLRVALVLGTLACGVKYVLSTPTPSYCAWACSDVVLIKNCELETCAVYTLPNCTPCDLGDGYCRFRNAFPTPMNPRWCPASVVFGSAGAVRCRG